ncbi:MAG: hypothetical protein JWN08_3788 [Frankiales bacterium]|nr:hypothetical protein [Frankiales bacterium]
MTLETPDADEVVALRFEDETFAEQLALWCGGGVVGAVVVVPVGSGVAEAHAGQWIVRHPDGAFEVVDHEDFALRFCPSTG